jgi:hypothetical protein
MRPLRDAEIPGGLKATAKRIGPLRGHTTIEAMEIKYEIIPEDITYYSKEAAPGISVQTMQVRGSGF